MNGITGINGTKNISSLDGAEKIVGTTKTTKGNKAAVANKETQKTTIGGKLNKQSEALKEIAKLLKNLIESLSVMIAKLFGEGALTTQNGSSSPTNVVGATDSASSATSNTQVSATSTPDSTTTPNSSIVANPVQVSDELHSLDDVGSGDGVTDSPDAATVNIASIDDLSVRESQEAPTAEISHSSMGLQALKDETGAVSVLTDDGFKIRSEGKDQAWTIAGPDGNTTRIWGDPHVQEHDGDTWDFTKQSSFIFGKNKVTVETVPVDNGMTVSARITVYSGDERVTISGVNSGAPIIEGLARDGEQHDAQLSDGDVYTRAVNTRGESWSTTINGKKDVMGH